MATPAAGPGANSHCKSTLCTACIILLGASEKSTWGKADHLQEETGAWTSGSRISIQEGLRPLVSWKGVGLGTQLAVFAQNLLETSTVHDKIRGKCGDGVGC